MGFFLPDSRFDMPELLSPGRKPPANKVQIADSYKGVLERCLLFNNDFRCVASQQEYPPDTPTDFDHSFAANILTITEPDSGGPLGLPLYDFAKLNNGDWTAVFRVKPSGTGSYRALIDADNDSPFIGLNSNSFIWYSEISFDLSTLDTVTGNWWTLVADCKDEGGGNSTVRLFVNGIQRAINSNTAVDMAGQTVWFLKGDGDYCFQGDVDYIMFFNRRLNDAEHKALHQREFGRFLIPA